MLTSFHFILPINPLMELGIAISQNNLEINRHSPSLRSFIRGQQISCISLDRANYNCLVRINIEPLTAIRRS